MKTFGIRRKLEELGRIVIPCEYRKILGFSDREYLEIILVNDGVLIKKLSNTCKLCGTNGNLITFEGDFICFECVKKIKAVKF